MRHYAVPAILPHSCTENRITEQSDEGLDDSILIARIHNQTVFSVGDRLGNPALSPSNAGLAIVTSLQIDKSEPLPSTITTAHQGEYIAYRKIGRE